MRQDATFFGVLHSRQAAKATRGKCSGNGNPFPACSGARASWTVVINTTRQVEVSPSLIRHYYQRSTLALLYSASLRDRHYHLRAAVRTMKLIYSILTLAAATSAHPSPTSEEQIHNGPREIGIDGAVRPAAQCSVGQHYCFSAIIDDLSMSFRSSTPQVAHVSSL